MIRLRLLRHGTTRFNLEHRFLGWMDLPLLPEGRRQVSKVDFSREIFDSVWTSDLSRCLETAALVGVDAQRTASLREFNFGAIEGQTWDELSDETQQGLLKFDGFRAPQGEHFEDFSRRVTGFVSSLGEGHHLLVTHGGVIRFLLRRHGNETRIRPGEWIDLEFDGPVPVAAGSSSADALQDR